MSAIATMNDLIKSVNMFADAARKAGIVMRDILKPFRHWSRYADHFVKMSNLWWDVHDYPNNRRRTAGKPMIRRRAYKKAYRNERR